jgi:dTDP-4-amino-4,6-dideoxygalactose transaminase
MARRNGRAAARVSAPTFGDDPATGRPSPADPPPETRAAGAPALRLKTRIGELAVHGGPPAFAEGVHVGRPNVGDRRRLLERIDGVLDRRWLSNGGPLVQELEARIAELAEVEHCVAMGNATVALEVAARALGLEGEVILPSFTFVATAHALRWQGITPVFCDIAADHCIDPARVEELITPRTSGLVGVHLWGRSCDVEALAELAERHRLKLLFDAAHAFGCTRRGRPIGGSGAAEVFSFHATKFVNSGEGGAVVTNDGALAERIRLMSNFGFSGYDRVVALGTNGKMSELAAAMGLTSLESMDEYAATNRANHRQYRRELAGLPGVEPMPYDESERCNYQYVVLEIDEARAGVGRDRLIEVLHAENVFARRYFYPGCHRMEPYRSELPDAAARLPRTERVAARVLVLPTGTAVGREEIAAICAILRLALEHGPSPA